MFRDALSPEKLDAEYTRLMVYLHSASRSQYPRLNQVKIVCNPVTLSAIAIYPANA